MSWSFTREALLACELRELERLLTARQEVAARLSPLAAPAVAALAAGAPVPMAGQQTAGVVVQAPAPAPDLPLVPSSSGATSAGSSDVFAGLQLGLADGAVASLEVGVVEVTGLAPRSGWSQDLTRALLSSAAAGSARGAGGGAAGLPEVVQRSDLPLPVVYVFCGTGGPDDSGFEASVYSSAQKQANT